MNEGLVIQKTFDRSYAITLAAVFYIGIASGGLSNFTPLIVGALIDDYHFSPSQAGFVAGIEMAGIGISAMIVALLGGAWNRRLIVLAGTTLGVLGSVAGDDTILVIAAEEHGGSSLANEFRVLAGLSEVVDEKMKGK